MTYINNIKSLIAQMKSEKDLEEKARLNKFIADDLKSHKDVLLSKKEYLEIKKELEN